MAQKLEFSLKKLIGIPLLFISVIILTVFFCSLYIKYLNNLETQSLHTYMNEITEKTAITIQNRIKCYEDSLQTLSAVISWSEINQDNILDLLHEQILTNQFSRIGVINSAGNGIGIDKKLGVVSGNFLHRNYFQASIVGDIVVNSLAEDYFETGIPLFVISVPIYANNSTAVTGVLCGFISETELREKVDLPVFSGQAKFHIIDTDGNILVLSKYADFSGNSRNFFDNDFERLFYYDEMVANIKEGRSGSFGFKLYGSPSQLATYQSIGIDDWVLMLVAPVSILQEKQNNIRIASLLLTSVVVIIILFLFTLISLLRHKTKKEINYLAYHDQLTGSYNYTKFKLEFEKKKDAFSSHYALAVLDIYNFRAVNAIFGYAAGDSVLRGIHNLIKSFVTPNELFCRFSADTFLLLLECPSKEFVLNRLHAFFRLVQNTILSSNNMDYTILCRCGLYELEPEDAAKSFQTLTDSAFEVRENIISISRSTVAFFDENLQQKLDRKNKITRYMNSSFEKEEFLVYLQPKYAILGDQPLLSGAEALVRWKLHGTEFIYPDSFIPAFEENGFITQLDMYILDHVCKLIRSWRDNGYPVVPISINQSRLHIYNPNYVYDIQHIVDKYDIPYNLIEFEITESAVVDDAQKVRSQFRHLRSLGFKTSMDDFGSGLSTLNMLHGTEADIIKIDKGFFDSSLDTEGGQIIVASIINMLRNLNFDIVAEGIETGEQVAFLKKSGCTYVQGYYFGKPSPPADFVQNHLNRKAPNLLVV